MRCSKAAIVLCSAGMFTFGCANLRPEPSHVSSAPRVLFIGNSFTSANNLPQIFQDIATSGRRPTPEIKAIAPNGLGLHEHLNSPETLGLVGEGNWDLVILQGGSAEAALSEEFPEVRDQFLKATAGLYDRIKSRNPQAEVILFENPALTPIFGGAQT